MHMSVVTLLILLILLVLIVLLATVGRKLSELRKYDVAYGCFLFCGFVILPNMIASLIPMSMQTEAIFVLGVFGPLMFVTLVALIVAIGLSISLRHHKPLVVISLLTVVVAFVAATPFVPAVFVLVPYAVMTIWLSLRWFLVLRKQLGKNV